MSKNFFAALDDSGDEAPAAPAKKSVEKKPVKPKTAADKKPAPTSKIDQKRRPNQGDRGTKFGRGGPAPGRDGKRQFDRKSGTGRGRETKKGGGGARNWGSDKNEARQAEGHIEEDTPVGEEVPKEDETENNEAAAEEEQVEAEPEPEPEPEEVTMTYEEYMAEKANPDNEAFAPVKERKIEDEFAGMAVAKKKKEEEEDFLVMGGGKQKKKKQNKGNQKTSITPAFRVKSSGDDERRDGGGRGRGRGGRDGEGRGRGGRGDGRGRGRDGGRGRGGRDGRGRGGRDGRGRDGGRGRSGGRGGGRGGRALNAMDESAFPKLG